MKQCVINVATGRYTVGQERLRQALGDTPFLGWTDSLPPCSPTHQEKPYAFKAFALLEAAKKGYLSLLWVDACIVPTGPLDRIWARAAEHGAWFSHNGFWNSEWTAKEAYEPLGVTVEENQRIPHVVATAFALDLRHPKGAAFLAEFYRMAATTRAFCGPWKGGVGVQHRHDQTAASVIAWRLGIPLSSPPDVFCYRGGETDQTILIADGAY